VNAAATPASSASSRRSASRNARSASDYVVGVANAHRHLEGELTRLGRGERPRGVREAAPLEQHILVQRRHVERGVAREPLGDALDRGALAVVLGAVREGGHQRNGEDGLLFGLVHGVS
jgi:hypothetical protein